MGQFPGLRHRWSLSFLLSLALAGSLAAQATAPTGAIDVTITGIRVTQGGELIVALYDRPGGWLQTDSALAVRKLPVGADSVVTVAFDGLAADTGYAITVIHDKNGNGKMDMRWFPYPKPKEGTGVSQNHVRAGPPEYGKALVAVRDSTARITIEMRY
jgi:uncharacterized protein (DUF2141 family)